MTASRVNISKYVEQVVGFLKADGEGNCGKITHNLCWTGDSLYFYSPDLKHSYEKHAGLVLIGEIDWDDYTIEFNPTIHFFPISKRIFKEACAQCGWWFELPADPVTSAAAARQKAWKAPELDITEETIGKVAS